MGNFDGTEVCELVGALILSQLSRIINNTDMGLYRDDGLIIIRKPNEPKLDNYRKRISNTLKLLGFKSTIHTNLKTVTLNLTNCTYEPYKKDNNTSIYIHSSSNHPPSITKQIPKSISRRLSSNSSNINIFNKHKHLYDDALKQSGYKQEVKFTPPKVNSKHRSRNIIWFNPPYNKCIFSNIGRDFLNLISKHFPYNSPLAKIFNKNKIKISYSCTNNMAQIIKKHNKKIASTNSTPQPYNQCNCRVKSTCHLPNKSLYKNTIYKATVKTNNSVKHYIGAVEGTIKQTIHNHNLSFKYRNYASNTALSSYIWQRKDKNISPTITWEILKQAPAYNKTSKKCLLCLHEKSAITKHPPK